MSLNFNIDPYYDDFDPSKNYYRVLFKPGYAVQARELIQSQTILQDQVHKFADNIFKQNSPVTGGQITTNLNCHYIKLENVYDNITVNVDQFLNKTIKNADGTILAQVVQVSAGSTVGAGDPPTLIVIYKSGNQFTDGDVIYDADNINLATQAIASNATGMSSVVSIAQGVFYISSSYQNSSGTPITTGVFVQANPQTIIVNKYSNTPSVRIGLNIVESKQTFVDDSTLLDPAIGASNYQAPGADRYKIALNLETRPLSLGDDDTFIELVRIENGIIQKMVDGSVYNIIDDYFAKRDYETNGDYIVNDFKLTPKITPVTTDPLANTYIMSVSKGIAYVHGYRVESLSSTDLVTNRARTTKTENNNGVFLDYGSYFYVDNVNGANGSFFDTTTYGSIDLHCVPKANVNTTSADTYNSTLVSSGYIRSLVYDHNTSAAANSYVYKAYVSDLQNSVISDNALSATVNTITFPSYFSSSNASYIGVNISISSGTDAGDFRTITSYNGVTKVATVNQNWTTTPDTTSVFNLNFDTKDVESIVYASKTSYPATINGYASINIGSRANNVSSGLTVLQNPTVPELIFTVGNPYVSDLTDTSYTTEILARSVQFNGGTYDFDLSSFGSSITHFGTSSAAVNSDLVKQNFVVIVTNKGTNSSINVGDLLTFTTGSRSITLNSTKTIATLTAPDLLNSFQADIIAKVLVNNADDSSYIRKTKTLITANTKIVNTSNTAVVSGIFVDDTSTTSTGQVYIRNAALAAPGTKQTLYLSDVKNIVKIIDTGSPTVYPDANILANPSYDITSNYIFDNGQRDNYYDHASITLRPGAPQPIGNVLVCVNYYQHSGGDGYFSKVSYANETYQNIPKYTNKNGITYALRDCIDFRPARKNAQTQFVFRYNNLSTTTSGAFLPVDLTLFNCDYSYYLGRKDKLILTKDRSFNVIEGTPSINPIFPTEPDGALVIAQLTHNPYTGYIPTEAPNGYVSDLSIEKVKHKRYTMQDISGLESRINQIEYYTSLSLLEQKAQNLQISDAYGLNRFKNGILVDDFSSYAAADTLNQDYAATINRRTRQLTATQNVKNYPLKSLATVYNMGLLSSDTSSSLGYAINNDGYINYYSLPITAVANVATQKFASRTVNVNPFSYTTQEGILSLSPNVDNWVDTNHAPALLITDPNLQIFRADTAAINVLTAGDWQTISGTTTSTTTYTEGHGINPSPYGYVGYSTTQTATALTQASTVVLGPYAKINNTYQMASGYITDISILPFIRPQQVVVRAKNLLFNSSVETTFDNVVVNNYVRKTNVIELTGVTGTFNEDDVVGYYVSPNFTPTGRVVGVYYYPGVAGKVRLYVAADATTVNYAPSGTLQNAWFNSAGAYATSTASGTILSTIHYGGRLARANSTTTVQLSKLAPTTDNYYTGNTIYFNIGTGAGQSATISQYYGANQVAVLASAVTTANGDIYSIGNFNTNEHGDFYGIFNIPGNTFHTGQRVVRVDNGVNGNKETATTYAEATYYAEGLQTTSQTLDFGASPSGAKGTFTQTISQTTSSVQVTTSPWDPVAQTIIVSSDNYPNGIFLKSIKLFFRTKPTDNSPISLYMVGTLNGYPNGQTLDHSIVTMSPDKIKVSENPQYLDASTYTEFTFKSPVYIQPNTLYAFIVKSNSNQYTLWVGANGDTAVASSVKNLPTDNLPTTLTKIGSAPYVGSLFISQNSQTWTADQNQSLMFVADRCVFDKTAQPTIQFVIPKKLPQRTLVDQSLDYYLDANSISSVVDAVSNNSVYVDAFNVTTTDFVPTTTNIVYNYNATLTSGLSAGQNNITPGKYATSAVDNIYLNDGKGERVLDANSMTSFSVYTQLSSADDAVSPIISDAGLTTYAITWNINNCPLSNNLIQLTDGGSGYNVACTTVTVSAPTGIGGTQAYASANIVSGVVKSIYITTPGSGYITTPTLTITDANSSPGLGAAATIIGETSSSGGPATAKYVTKKVVLDAGFDSGDLNVYLTAYRPINTDINVYYKILNRNDTQTFESSNWQLMTKTNSSNTSFSQTRSDLYEYSFAPGTSGVEQGYVTYTSTNGQIYTTFSQFAIKVVLTTTDNTAVPFVTDLRAIALPSNVNLTV